MSQPPPEEEGRHRRGLKFRKREDYAIELFRQAQASLGDVAQVDRLLLQLGRFYNPYVNAPIVDLETRKRVVSLPPTGVEALLGPATECMAALGAEDGPALQRFAEGWNRGNVGQEILFPYRRDGQSPRAGVGLGADVLSFLACASLRPTQFSRSQ